ncbi:MAG: hypothetical protein EAZ20_16250, partial [Bacteroidetes bacterium]
RLLLVGHKQGRIGCLNTYFFKNFKYIQNFYSNKKITTKKNNHKKILYSQKINLYLHLKRIDEINSIANITLNSIY